jgi:hypothetical protein
MIARALPETITNAVSAINKGVFFMTTSLLRAPSINAQILSVVQYDPAMGGKRRGLATSADVRCLPFWAGPANVWSYPTFPPPIQSELFDTDSESDPAQRQQMPGAFKPPRPPKRLCGIRAYKTPARPRWGLCFVCGGSRPPYRDRHLTPSIASSRRSAISTSPGSSSPRAAPGRGRRLLTTPFPIENGRVDQLTL